MTGIQEDLSVIRPFRKTMRRESSVPLVRVWWIEAVGLWGRVRSVWVISLGTTVAG